MCVIVQKPKKVLFPEKDIESAYIVNPHGFGYMYYDKSLKKIQTFRSVDISKDEVQKIFKGLKNEEVCFHFRWCTEGDKTKKQAHPFKVLSKNKHGVDMYFMHNGTIKAILKKDLLEGESDTQAFNRLILHPILREKPDLIKNKSFHKMLREYIGYTSRLCFMYGDGEIVKINEHLGNEKEDCWVSNLYSFNRNHRQSTKNNNNNVRNVYSDYNNTSYRRHTYQSNYKQSETPYLKQNRRVVSMFGINIRTGDELYIYDTHSKDDIPLIGEITYISEDLKVLAAGFKTEEQQKGKMYVRFSVETGLSYGGTNLSEDRYWACPGESFKGQEKETLNLQLDKQLDNVINLDDKSDKNIDTKKKSKSQQSDTPPLLTNNPRIESVMTNLLLPLGQ
jgi:predicted glutamine amidotransferase